MIREERYQELEIAAHRRAARRAFWGVLPWFAVVVATLGVVWMNAS